MGAIGDRFNSLESALWAAIEKEIGTDDIEVFSYSPDLESDPFASHGSLWSFNYFFYTKKLKRTIFFTCHATRWVLIAAKVGGRLVVPSGWWSLTLVPLAAARRCLVTRQKAIPATLTTRRCSSTLQKGWWVGHCLQCFSQRVHGLW